MSGKSSLFRLLTGAEATAGGGQPGRAEQRQTRVEDERLDRLAADYSPKKITPATIDFLDFPAIVKPGGGERKSCADLLAPAREAQGLIIVVRNFENPNVPPLRGKLEPVAELDELLEELRLADLEITNNRLERLEKTIPRRQGDERKTLEDEQALLLRIVEHLEAGKDVAELSLSDTEEKMIRGFQFLSGKPRLVVENTSNGGVQDVADSISVQVAIEMELAELDEESREVFAEEYGFTEPGRDRVIGEIYKRVGLISFLTAGEPEVRAWTIPVGTSAVDAAGAIHSDISRGFIRAEVVAYGDYIADGGINGAKDKGHFRLEGKEYVVEDGDIILFRFNV